MSYSYKFGIIVKLCDHTTFLQSFIGIAYTEVEIQLFKVGKPGVVQEAALRKRRRPVQSQWAFVNFSTNFAEILIFSSNFGQLS